MRKLYVHHPSTKRTDHIETFILRTQWNDTTRVEELCKEIESQPRIGAEVEVRPRERKQALLPRQKVSSYFSNPWEARSSVWQDSDDVFVSWKEVASEGKPVVSSAPVPAASSTPASASDRSMEEVRQLLRRAEELYESKSYRKARSIWQSIPSETDDPMPRVLALRGRARVQMSQRRFVKAARLLEQARDLPVDGARPDILMELSESLLHTGREGVGNALKYAQESLRRLQQSAPLLGRADWDRFLRGIPPTRGPGFLRLYKLDAQGHYTRTDATVACARALRALGGEGDAVALLNQVLGEGESHPAILVTYASVCAGQGMQRDAISAYMKAIVQRQTDTCVREPLAEMLMDPTAVDIVLQMLEPSTESASAMAFLGTAAKDHGAVEAAVALFEVAWRLHPTNMNHALNWVHALEALGEVQQAVCAARDVLRSLGANGVLTVGETRAQLQDDILPVLDLVTDDVYCFARAGGVPCPAVRRWVDGGMDPLRTGRRPGANAFHEHMRSNEGTRCREGMRPVEGMAKEGVRAAARVQRREPSEAERNEAWRQAERIAAHPRVQGLSVEWVPGDYPFARVRCLPQGADEHPLASHVSEDPPAEQRQFPLGQQDLMALLMTVVKLLHASGAVPVLPPIIAVLERVRRGCELHKTLIRNEAAYYGCIAQCLPHLLPAGRSNAVVSFVERIRSGEPLFFIGDSHTTSPAWQVVPVGEEGRRRCLVPALVTGVKAWHLRPDSRFYPKVNFESVVGALPVGCEAIVDIGEIDCREGVLVAVERCAYKDVDHGMRVVLEHYMRVLRLLATNRKMRLLVHPVAPVLNETRTLVRHFNMRLRSAVSDLAQELRRERAEGDVVLLDFGRELLSDDETQLREEYALDGTHLHPGYLELLSKPEA